MCVQQINAKSLNVLYVNIKQNFYVTDNHVMIIEFGGCSMFINFVQIYNFITELEKFWSIHFCFTS